MTPTRNEIRRDDSDRVGAAFLDDLEQVDPSVARLAADEFCEGERQIAEEGQKLAHREAVAERHVAHPLEERDARVRAARALLLGNRFGQFEQAPEAGRKSGAVLGDTAGAAGLRRIAQK